MTTRNDLIDDDTIAYLHLLRALADLDDIAHDLMTDDTRIGRGRVRTEIDTDIRTTDTRRGDLYQHVILFIDDRLLHIDDTKIIWLHNLNSFHTSVLLKHTSTRVFPVFSKIHV